MRSTPSLRSFPGVAFETVGLKKEKKKKKEKVYSHFVNIKFNKQQVYRRKHKNISKCSGVQVFRLGGGAGWGVWGEGEGGGGYIPKTMTAYHVALATAVTWLPPFMTDACRCFSGAKAVRSV